MEWEVLGVRIGIFYMKIREKRDSEPGVSAG